MKTILSTFFTILVSASLFSQPVLRGDSIHTGLSFNIYSLTNINVASLQQMGANINWNLSSSTATLLGTAEFLQMSATPYATQYPNANFAIKFNINGTTVYSLFNLTSTIFEEVGNNVSTSGGVPFLNPRTALIFPYTYNTIHSDTYQKTGQSNRTIIHKYDSYGNFTTSMATHNNVIRDLTIDNGDTAANFWSTTPAIPILTANSNGFTLWKLTSGLTGMSSINNNLMFDIYPNPAMDHLTIINKEPLLGIEVYNMCGQHEFSTTQSTVDISVLQPGIYFIKVNYVSGNAIQKFVKQ
ncbi:MAG: T9SS type A sorting domain-containing protein [Bacteroidia bacterium]|nr:T9SS type A sorting domain-containing protein [Bacteroidia bacterium]